MAFLIESNESKEGKGTRRKVLFDAGGRRDYWNYGEVVRERFRAGVSTERDKIWGGSDRG